MKTTSRQGTVLAIGAGQLVALASSTYLPAVVAAPIARDLGIAPATVFGAFSFALVAMAACGPVVGRAIDRYGGRGVLCLSNLVLAAGLALTGASSSPLMLFTAWGLVGLGMALGLYDTAFAALVRLYGARARAPMTGVTLVGGFGSTLGWTLTALLVAHWGWRNACFFWALVHLGTILPLHWLGVPETAPVSLRTHSVAKAHDTKSGPVPGRRELALLAVFGAATAFVTSAMAAHFPGLLLAAGASAAAAITAAALLGPAQVAARLLELGAAHRFRVHPLATARLASALHPVAGLGLAILGGTPIVAAGFAVLHGAGNGLITIAKGTLPLALFGPAGYGARLGPARRVPPPHDSGRSLRLRAGPGWLWRAGRHWVVGDTVAGGARRLTADRVGAVPRRP